MQLSSKPLKRDKILNVCNRHSKKVYCRYVDLIKCYEVPSRNVKRHSEALSVKVFFQPISSICNRCQQETLAFPASFCQLEIKKIVGLLHHPTPYCYLYPV